MRRTLALGALSLAAVTSACIGPALDVAPPEDASAGDAGLDARLPEDASAADAGADARIADDATKGGADAVSLDATATDAAPDTESAIDGGPHDAGTGADSTAAMDGSVGDASAPDSSGPYDAGSEDAGVVVDSGQPDSPCSGGFMWCSGACVDPSGIANCGACGNACTSNVTNGVSCAATGGGYSCTCAASLHACGSGCFSSTATPDVDPCIADPALATYVAPWGSASAAGTSPSAPVLTIEQGVVAADNASRARVYVCGGLYGTQVYADAVTGTVNLQLYGGFTCPEGGSWAYNPAAGVATVSPSAAGPALLSVTPTAKITLSFRDFVFQAGPTPVAAANGTGASSIAAIVNGGDVTFQNVTFKANAGQSGGDAGPTTETLPVPVVGGAASSAANTGGAAGAISKCAAGDSTAGGVGGAGSVSGGTSGAQGVPDAGANGGAGTASAGVCSSGATGLDGADGLPGGAATAYGSYSAGSWVPSSGGNGGYGSAGQGGGGGGGGTASVGAGGGGGGSGGCGGLGGYGGGGGGASIGLLILGDAAVGLSNCTIVTGAGGNGANGGIGMSGGNGAGGGPHADGGAGCSGGAGGKGGTGASGAGGTAGLSVGVLIQDGGGATVSITDAAFTIGQPGTPGGGSNGAAQGEPGVSDSVLAL